MDDSHWIPFFFDANSGFGEIRSALEWRALLERLAAGWHESWERTLDRALDEARMAPLADIPPEYVGGPTPTVPTDIPTFGFRREHNSGMIILSGWALAHGMNLRKAAGRPPFALRLGGSWLLGFAHGAIPSWSPHSEEAVRYGTPAEAQWVAQALKLPCTVERLPP